MDESVKDRRQGMTVIDVVRVALLCFVAVAGRALSRVSFELDDVRRYPVMPGCSVCPMKDAELGG